MNDTAEPTVMNDNKRASTLSKDGCWRSFSKVPNLLQYFSTGTYYARVKVNGKIIRQSLKTDVWTTAKLRLIDFLKDKTQARIPEQVVTFGDALKLFRADLAINTAIKPQSKEYRQWCIQKLLTTWPDLEKRGIASLNERECIEWAAKLRKETACDYYNNVIGSLNLVLATGIKEHVSKGGVPFLNPAAVIPRAKKRQIELRLPEPSQFKDFLNAVKEVAPQAGMQTAQMIEFLAYSGVRAFSEAEWITWEDIDWQRKEIIVRGHPDTATKNGEIRRVPILPNMDELLGRLKADTDEKGKILHVPRCDPILTKACAKIGIATLTLHDFRHLFATRCIESGVDIPTVSRWLGHKDGGALAMKTYGHLRNEHSRQMAEKVKF